MLCVTGLVQVWSVKAIGFLLNQRKVMQNRVEAVSEVVFNTCGVYWTSTQPPNAHIKRIVPFLFLPLSFPRLRCVAPTSTSYPPSSPLLSHSFIPFLPSSNFHLPHFSPAVCCFPASPSPSPPAACGFLGQCRYCPLASSPEGCSGSSSLHIHNLKKDC